jgi:hypothetical protein
MSLGVLVRRYAVRPDLEKGKCEGKRDTAQRASIEEGKARERECLGAGQWVEPYLTEIGRP